MMNFLRRLYRNESGNMIILTAIIMPVLIGMAGLATDTIQWSLWKRQLQRAADSAAIAGVYERNATALGATTSVETAVTRDLALHQKAGVLDKDPVIGFPGDEPAPARRFNQVSVELEISRTLAFSSFFMAEPPVIRVTSTAASVPGAGEYCVISLDPRDVTGTEIGGSADVDLGKCCLISNSTHSNKAFLHTGNGSKVKAGCIAAAGGVDESDSTKWNVGDYFPYSEPAADPYAALPTPVATDCDENIVIGSQNADYPLDRSTASVADEGKTVCINGGFSIKGALTLGSATYVINTSGTNDDLGMTEATASLSCVKCTIILTNFADRTKTGNIKLTGGTVNISAPTAVGETYRGVVLYQDRLALDDDKRGANHVNGGSASTIQGVMYMPSRSLLYNGGGGIAEETCMQLIAARVDFGGNSKFKMGSTCGGAGMHGHTGGGWLVRLVA